MTITRPRSRRPVRRIEGVHKPADELLELHNDTWAPEDAVAPMKRGEFIKRIAPSSLVRDIDGSGFFYWADDDMFAGHWIELRFRKDYTISEVGLAG